MRATLARLADALCGRRGWERLGYARIEDYAVERAGLTGRSLRELGEVGAVLVRHPPLERALVSGALGWTQVRLLCRVVREDDVEDWIAFAQTVTADALAREVRGVDSGSVEAGAADDEARRRSAYLSIPCAPGVYSAWMLTRTVAQRVAGQPVSPGAAAELVAAEVLSAAPLEASVGPALEPVRGAGTEERGGQPRRPAPLASEELPVVLQPLVDGLEDVEAQELDRRLQVAVLMEQRLDAELGPLLALVWRTRVHRALGYATREAYARDRLGMDVTRARALIRLERGAAASPAFACVYRRGSLSWVKASTLLPIVLADTTQRWTGDWLAWASRITVRRLRDDVGRALDDLECAPESWGKDGGLPPEARGEAVISERREIRAKQSGEQETCQASFIGSPDVVQLFRAVLCTVRRRIERQTGKLPSPGEALGAMCAHALDAWGADRRVPARHRVFERDGWRCVVPGCTSMRNLHDHHIHFRSAGGGNELENRVTLCAFHHLRGVHAGLLDCAGRAPDRLRFEFGGRRYASGDLQL